VLFLLSSDVNDYSSTRHWTMGKEKAGFLTPKAISNRIKAKGLQKLRWYCQMCQKQCRDENGFKCHLMSESHQRQLLLVAENPEKFIDTFSQTFLDDFMDLVRRQYGTKRVHANQVRSYCANFIFLWVQCYVNVLHKLMVTFIREITIGKRTSVVPL